MFKVNSYVVYKKDVCIVKEILKNYARGLDYYLLVPINDKSLSIKIPVLGNSSLRSLITKTEVENILKNIPNIEVLDLDNKNLENEYMNLLHHGTHENLIKVIKTSYLRNEIRVGANRKISEKDNYYFQMAEKYLYTEFSVVLGLSLEETKNFVISKVEELIK